MVRVDWIHRVDRVNRVDGVNWIWNVGGVCGRAVGCTAAKLIADASLVIVSGIERVACLPWDKLTSRISTPRIVKVAWNISRSSIREQILLSSTAHTRSCGILGFKSKEV